MAQFRTHVSFGFTLAVIGSIALVTLSLVTNSMFLIPFIGAILLGSVLPDLDSDDGIPFQATFWMLSVAGAGIAFYILSSREYTNLLMIIGIPIVVFLLIRFPAGSLFKKATKHRGMLHSIPAAAIAGISAYFIANAVHAGEITRCFFPFGVSIGYIGHLILDEIYSTINFNGDIFKPKKSLGSALKFFSKKPLINIFTYALLAILVYLIF